VCVCVKARKHARTRILAGHQTIACDSEEADASRPTDGDKSFQGVIVVVSIIDSRCSRWGVDGHDERTSKKTSAAGSDIPDRQACLASDGQCAASNTGKGVAQLHSHTIGKNGATAALHRPVGMSQETVQYTSIPPVTVQRRLERTRSEVQRSTGVSFSRFLDRFLFALAVGTR